MRTLIENVTIATMNAEKKIIKEGYMIFDENIIHEVGEGNYAGERNGVNVLDGKDRIMIPGLINAHTHSYANIVKGTTENVPLEIWMLYIMAEGKYMSRGDHEVSAALGGIEMLKSGTTTFLDHLAQDLEGLRVVANQYKKIGIRSVLTPMFGDRPYALSLPEEIDLGEMGGKPHGPSSSSAGNWKQLIEMVEDVVKNLLQPEKGISVAVGPSGAQRCSDELLIASMDLANKYNLPWHTHLLETKAQEVTAHRQFGKSMVAHLDHLGILNEKVSFAHGVWVSPEEIELIRARGASIVHNPASNLTLGSGILPMIPLKESGVNLALGTDGPNCSGFQSMFESMKLAAILSNTHTFDYTKWITAAEVLDMATRGSARAIGMSDKIGSIEPGKKADFVLLNSKVTNFVPLNNLVWQLVYGRADSAIDSVFVNGNKLVENGKVTSIDEESVYKEAVERGAFLMKKCQDDYGIIKRASPKLYDMLMRVAVQPTNRA
jgi:cytosine/adenosine deaminase-related metal-dependent hydrolase